jgi:hypothetical protein
MSFRSMYEVIGMVAMVGQGPPYGVQ